MLPNPKSKQILAPIPPKSQVVPKIQKTAAKLSSDLPKVVKAAAQKKSDVV